jgi:membrane-bound lytic murein transglycosylase A
MIRMKMWLIILITIALGAALYTYRQPIFCVVESFFSSKKTLLDKYPVQLKKRSFDTLEGWKQSDLKHASKAITNVCSIIMKKKSTRYLDELRIYGQWSVYQSACRKLLEAASLKKSDAIKTVLEEQFVPYQVLMKNTKQSEKALFTGYYEPELKGSLKKQGKYVYPLYKTPKNLVVSQDLGLFNEKLAGHKIKGVVEKGVFKPYHKRHEIDALNEHPDFEPLIWVDNEVDAFFLHIQGSGSVRLQDGTWVRVGYAEQNGHRYVSIGHVLLDMGVAEKAQMSMQFIKKWFRENPGKIKQLLHKNPSYIFFRKLKGEGPVGTMGIPLVPEHNLAVDRSVYPLGLPMWISFHDPFELDTTLHRFVVAADTGGAIKGPLRGDLFWGRGEKAELNAGHMKSTGTLVVFLPKELKLPPSVVA